MPKPTALAIDLLRIDGETQSRVSINEDVVEDYAGIISENGKTWPFPPVDVFHDGTDYFLADGFHRVLGGHRAKRGSIPSIIHKGTARDARIFGMTANDKHGLRMSRADKRACVEWLLDQPGKMTQAEIAEKAGVSPRTVRGIVFDRKPKVELPPPRSGRQTSGSSGGCDPFDEAAHVDSEALEPDSTEESTPAPKGRRAKPQEELEPCPNCRGNSWTDEGDGLACKKCHHPYGEPAGDVDDPAAAARNQVKIWLQTIGRWLGSSPSIDEYRAQFPSKHGDAAVKAATTLIEQFKLWQKVIK